MAWIVQVPPSPSPPQASLAGPLPGRPPRTVSGHLHDLVLQEQQSLVGEDDQAGALAVRPSSHALDLLALPQVLRETLDLSTAAKFDRILSLAAAMSWTSPAFPEALVCPGSRGAA